MTEETLKCVKGESCIHCGSTYCRFVDEVNELEQENERLKDELNKTIKEYNYFNKACVEANTKNIELQRENESLRSIITDGRAENKRLIQECRNNDKYKSALEEIKECLSTLSSIDSDFPNTETYLRINDIINEVLNLS